MEFQVGDKVMLKVSPWKGVVCFGKRGKLNPMYVGPFKVLEEIGKVAYKLKLPEELSRVHNTFHVSNLKKCHADEPLAIPLDGLHFDDKLYFVEELVEIVDREVKQLKQSQIPLVMVTVLPDCSASLLVVVSSGSCKHLAVVSLIFWQWQQPLLTVGTYTASGNSILAEAELILPRKSLYCQSRLTKYLVLLLTFDIGKKSILDLGQNKDSFKLKKAVFGFVEDMITKGKIVGILDLMIQKSKRMKQKDQSHHCGTLQADGVI
nr:putative reverse transcriptase domain-containing protein [Tanacetum cinerariifolium]